MVGSWVSVIASSSSDSERLLRNMDEYVPPLHDKFSAAPEWLYAVDVGLLVLLMTMCTVVILRHKHPRWLWIAQGVSLAWFGFLRHGCLCPVGSVGNVARAAFHPEVVLGVVALVYFFVPLIFALIAGRVYCGAVCPLGTVQDIVGWRARNAAGNPVMRGKKRRKQGSKGVPWWHRAVVPAIPRKVEKTLGLLAWVFLAWAIWAAYRDGDMPICRYDPFVPLFRMAGSTATWLFTGGVLLSCVFISRPYCRWFCPYGVLLGLVTRVAFFRRVVNLDSCKSCRQCERCCPMNCVENSKLDSSSCVLCGRCMEICRRDAIVQTDINQAGVQVTVSANKKKERGKT